MPDAAYDVRAKRDARLHYVARQRAVLEPQVHIVFEPVVNLDIPASRRLQNSHPSFVLDAFNLAESVEVFSAVLRDAVTLSARNQVAFHQNKASEEHTDRPVCARDNVEYPVDERLLTERWRQRIRVIDENADDDRGHNTEEAVHEPGQRRH